jgi:hypothetical protein
VDGVEANVEEVGPQGGGIPARRDEGAVAGARGCSDLVALAQRRWDVQHLVCRVPGRHRRRLADEHQRVVEPSQVVERGDGVEGDVVELGAAVGRA